MESRINKQETWVLTSCATKLWTIHLAINRQTFALGCPTEISNSCPKYFPPSLTTPCTHTHTSRHKHAHISSYHLNRWPRAGFWESPSPSYLTSSQLANSVTNPSNPTPPLHFLRHCLRSGPHYPWPGLDYYRRLMGILASTLALFQSICHPTCQHTELSKTEMVTALLMFNLLSTTNWMKPKVSSRTSQSICDLSSALFPHFIFHHS